MRNESKSAAPSRARGLVDRVGKSQRAEEESSNDAERQSTVSEGETQKASSAAGPEVGEEQTDSQTCCSGVFCGNFASKAACISHSYQYGPEQLRKRNAFQKLDIEYRTRGPKAYRGGAEEAPREREERNAGALQR